MDLREDFKRDWRMQFVNASLPDLRCFASAKGVNHDLFNAFDLDEKELKERLEQVKFTLEWIVRKREVLKKSFKEECSPNREYANIAPNSMKMIPSKTASAKQNSTDFNSNKTDLQEDEYLIPAGRRGASHPMKDDVKESISAVRHTLESQLAESRNDIDKLDQLYQSMKTNLAKKLTIDDCHPLSFYFSSITGQDRTRITSTSSFIDLLEKVAAISVLHVDDLMGALKREQLQEASLIVKKYRDVIKGSGEEYLEMLPVKVDIVDNVVPDHDLKTLSRKIDKTYKTFGRDVLKFTAKEIQKCQVAADEEHQQALRMLLKWKQRLGRQATTAQLLALLKEFKYGQDIWGFLEGIDTSEGDRNDEPVTWDSEWYQAVVVRGYVKVSEDELSVKRGDKIMIQDSGRPGWYFGEVMNQRGWVPNYCVREEDETQKELRFLFVVKANFDSGLREKGFLTYRMGEHLDVIEETYMKTVKVYRARNKDGFIGFIQRGNFIQLHRQETILCDRDWFHPKLMRHQAEMLLRSCVTGDYLIREANKNKPGHFVLNVKTVDDIANFLIKTTNVGYMILDKKFNSILEIITYYKRNPLKRNVYLRFPVDKQ